MKRVYYARAVDGRDRSELRTVAQELRKTLAQRDWELLDPIEYGDVVVPPLHTAIVEDDLTLLRTADAVLMDLSLERWTYVGCICELVYAHLWRIPVIVYITGPTLSERAWLRYHATRITSDRDAALAALEEILAHGKNIAPLDSGPDGAT